MTALLAADPHRHVTVLTRRATCISPHPRVTALAGDLRAPRLGLSSCDWETLTRSATEIIHCGADIRFNLPLAEAAAVNVAGRSALLDLARRARDLHRFVHISTVYIFGRDEGNLAEAEHVNRSGFFNTYEHSKYEAERLVFGAMRQVPIAVFRLGSVVGEAATGQVNQFNYFHQILRLIPRSPLQVFPGRSDSTVDLIPEEWAVAALSCLYEQHFRPGAVYNVCAGPSDAIPVSRLVDEVYARFPTLPRPAMVRLDEFEAYVRLLSENDSSGLVRLTGALMSFLPHLAVRQRFDNHRTAGLLKSAGVVFPDAGFLGRILDYCTSVYGREQVSASGGTGARVETAIPRPKTEVEGRSIEPTRVHSADR